MITYTSWNHFIKIIRVWRGITFSIWKWRHIVTTSKALLFHLLFFRITTPWLWTHFWFNVVCIFLVKIIVTTSHNYWSLNSHLTTCPVAVLKCLAQWSISVPPENIRKYVSRGYRNGVQGLNGFMEIVRVGHF